MQCVKWQRRVLRDDTISKCIITKEAVDGTEKPVIEYRTEQVNKAQ